MTKYIIKNCPAYDICDIDWDCVANDVADLNCKDCTDCLLKQIVKKCKNSTYTTAQEILSMLEIQEVEDGNF